MPHYKLTYFDMDGGRGEPVRIAFHIAGIAFDDQARVVCRVSRGA